MQQGPTLKIISLWNNPITRTVVLANSKATIGGKLRYAMNKVSHVNPATPLKLADYFNINIPGVFKLNSIKPHEGQLIHSLNYLYMHYKW
uniref:Uncharacterized protein n=1 Tax=Helianthus annuus TaxID=4232 RepID=A0A1Y3BUD8_HELAN